MLEQGVVILDARLQAFQQHLETRCLGRLAAHIQRMDDGADPHQGRVAFQSKTRQQGFEGDAMPDVGEARAVEIESQRIRRTVLDALQPDEARPAVDEAANQPGGCQPVHPQVLPGGPGLLLKIGEGETLGLAVLEMRFVGRKAGRQRGFQSQQPRFSLELAGARKIILFDQGFVTAPQALQGFVGGRDILGQRIEVRQIRQQLGVFRSTVEHPPECG